ncbi:MAG: hypothetical protein H0V81_04435 [Solirubrobacterales bacterium]|nr:hypothetical protein [Solirubrobacterales bacterium]
MTLAISGYWVLGWAIGAIVVVVAAMLILAIASVARDVTRQADDITTALDGARANTEPLFAVKLTNHHLDRITRGVRRLLTGGAT